MGIYSLQDVYFANYIGSTGIGAINKTKWNILEVTTTNPYSVFIKVFDKSYNLKYIYYYNIDFGNNIETIQFDLNKNGFGVANIKFSEKINIDIQSEDIFEIYFGDDLIYKGFSANDIDLYSKEITLYPFLKRLQEWHYSGEFVNKTINVILLNVLSSLEAKTKIRFDNKYIDTGNNEPFSFKFENETVFDIIDKLTKLCNDRYWFVDKNNYLNIKQIQREKINKYMMLCTYNKMYEKIKITFDYSNIEATQYKVYRNNDDGNAEFVGVVGNIGNTNYPPLPILDKVREIEGIYTASEVCSLKLAKDLAYSELKQKAKIKQNVSITNINLKYYIPKIDDYIYFEYINRYVNNYPEIRSIVDNVTQIKYKIDKDGTKCDFQCGDLLQEEGEELYKLKKKVRILETINNI